MSSARRVHPDFTEVRHREVMSTADPFLPIDGADDGDHTEAPVQPEDLGPEDETEPDVFPGGEAGGDTIPVPDEEPLFNTPTGEQVDPSTD
jgi:hypothetical protein